MRSRLRFAPLVASLALAIVPATAVQAQDAPRSNTKGLLLGFFLNGTSIDSDELDTDSESGGGFNAQVGWGFTPRFTLLLGAAGARMDGNDDDFVLVHLDLLARFNFRSGAHALVPFIEGGVSARVAGQDDAVLAGGGPPQTVDLEIAGGALTLGGGVHYFVSQWVALGANLQFSTGEFSTVEFNDIEIEGFELDATTARLNLGVTLYPMVPGR